MTFKYRGYDKNGKRTRGIIEATDIKDAKQRIKSKNILLSSISPIRENKKILSLVRASKIPTLLISNFSKELSIYLKSSIQVATALKLLKQLYAHKRKTSLFISSLISNVEEGQSLYISMKSQQIYKLPNFYVQSINIAEQSGHLSEVLEKMSQYFKDQNQTKNQITQALAYPLFILFVSVMTVGFMISVIVPKIASIFADLDQQLPPLTKFVISLGNYLTQNWTKLLLALIIFIISFILLYKLTYSFRKAIDRLVLSLPSFGRIVENFELARFSYMVSTMIESGNSFTQSISTSSSVVQNSILKERMENACNRVVEGNRFSVSLSQQRGFKINKTFVQAVALAEESSQVSTILSNITELYVEQNQNKIKIFLSLLEPMMMLIIGGTVGTIVAAMMLPIFSINLQSSF